MNIINSGSSQSPIVGQLRWETPGRGTYRDREGGTAETRPSAAPTRRGSNGDPEEAPPPAAAAAAAVGVRLIRTGREWKRLRLRLRLRLRRAGRLRGVPSPPPKIFYSARSLT
uniref:Uncharacterized protein n=1 Tax=Oryza brachyantha TaxID=4533 RepID=J3LII9_ORYBR